jgi:hypothetical protein
VSAKLRLDFATANGRITYVDAVLFEASGYLQPYFDGSTGYGELADLLWENGSTSSGRSLYYLNRVAVLKRLKSVLPDYLPMYAPYAVFIGVSL